MKNIRVIPRLDIKGSNVVKPVHAEALRVVGRPQEMAMKYYHEGADEIFYLDIVASLYQRNLDFDLLKDTTKDIFVPITVGGGIRSIYDINNVLNAGADKVAINTHAIKEPTFLAEAVTKFGSQCIVLFVEAQKQSSGEYEAYTDGGRERTGLEVVHWIEKAIGLGVGEVLISSIGQDGTRSGFDQELLERVNAVSPVPVIVHGGGGSFDSFVKAVTIGGADAVAASSVFHYGDYTIAELKTYLKSHDINVRML